MIFFWAIVVYFIAFHHNMCHLCNSVISEIVRFHCMSFVQSLEMTIVIQGLTNKFVLVFLAHFVVFLWLTNWANNFQYWAGVLEPQFIKVRPEKVFVFAPNKLRLLFWQQYEMETSSEMDLSEKWKELLLPWPNPPNTI